MTVCLRFAPSPTGLLHIGNARAALLNWLFTRKHHGTFILRIDDTDVSRSEERFTQAIQADLTWLGLSYDKMVKQSERFGRYQEIQRKLLEAGRLYPCYETSEELTFKRRQQRSRGLPPLYDRAALKLSQAEKDTFEKEGRRPHWRFKLEDKLVGWSDMIRGDVEFQGSLLSDPVLIREDGVPLYTLPSVVDDIDLAITHVIRGEDHVSNTAVQIQLIEAITGKPNTVQFGHFTLLTDAEGQGLSKRLGSLSLAALREEGIEAMAINSFLARLGTSLPIETIQTLEQLMESFDPSIFSRTPPRFSGEELRNLNARLLQNRSFQAVADQLREKGLGRLTEKHWSILRDNITTLRDLQPWVSILEGDLETPAIETEYAALALAALPPEPWTEGTWIQWTQALKDKTGRKGKLLFMPLRQALTGMDHGPEMQKILPLMDPCQVRKRLQKSVEASSE